MTEESPRQKPSEIRPRPIDVGMSVSALFETAFLGAASGRLADAGRLMVERVLAKPETLVGLALDANLTPGGTAVSSLVPLLASGYVDWLAVSGTNLYYDALFALGTPILRSVPAGGGPIEDCGGGMLVRRSDREKADAVLREILSGPDFQRPMGSAAMHHLIGRQLRTREKDLGTEYPSLLSTACEHGVPVYNPSPADSPLGSIIAGLAEEGNRLSLDASRDLNQAAAIFNAAHTAGAECAVWCLGRGTASGFMLGTPAHRVRILGSADRTDYAVRLRMAGRAHALPSAPIEQLAEGAPQTADEDDRTTWGPGRCDCTISTDLSIAVPLLVSFIVDRAAPRPLKRLVTRREDLLDDLRQDHLQATVKSLAEQTGLQRPAKP
jgi:deoxyhypusine synthase